MKQDSGLYLHIPFCGSKCSYCDFFSAPAMLKYQDDYVIALLGELKLRADEVPAPFTTIYIGGGTPSILSEKAITALLQGLKPYITDSLTEFTIEVNPEDVTSDLCDLYMSYGINRISMGIQTFDDNCLKIISRRHSAAKAIEAIELIKSKGFNYSCDLIYGLPAGNVSKSSFDVFKKSLQTLLNFNPPHFSAYLLSFEKGTKIYSQREKRIIKEATDEEAIEMYTYLCDTARANGYNHYEISNFALPGYEAKHNSKYWDSTPYLGIGCSAHSFDGKIRRYNPNNIPQYIDAICNKVTPCFIEEYTNDIERYNDTIITALRTSHGLSKGSIATRYPGYLANYFTRTSAALISQGKLIQKDNNIIIPEHFLLTADAILRELIYVE